MLSPDDDITRAEAAVILARMLAKPLPDATPVFADGADVPAWARDAVYTLAELGVMDVRNGYVEASATLNREQAAYMLYMLESVSE